MPTIKDIARAAGVSHGTVSNVLNKRGGVSYEKIRLVEETAIAMGYAIDEKASLLRRGTTRQMAVLLPGITQRRYADLYTGILRRAERQRYSVRLFITGDLPYQERHAIREALALKACGMLVVSCLEDPAREYAAAAARRMPLVFVERVPKEPSLYGMGFDMEAAARHVARRLPAQGPVYVLTGNARFADQAAFRAALERARPDCGDVFYENIRGAQSPAVHALLSKSGDAPWVVCTDEALADRVLTAFAQTSAQAPRIVTLSSLRPVQDARAYAVTLNYRRLGHEAAETVISHVEKKKALQSQTLPVSGEAAPPAGPACIRREPIRVLAHETPSVRALSLLLKRFTYQSGIPVELHACPMAEVFSRVRSWEGGRWDVVRIDPSTLSYLAPRLFRPLETLDPAAADAFSAYLPGLLDDFAVAGGRLYALPFDISVQMLFYQRALFDDAGQRRAFYEETGERLEVPRTYAAFDRLCRFFTRAHRPDSPVRYGASPAPASPTSVASDYLPRLLAAGGLAYGPAGRLNLVTPAARASLEAYVAYAACASPEPRKGWGDIAERFVAERAATAVLYVNHASGFVLAQNANVGMEIGFAPIPGGHPLLGGGSLGVCADARQPEEAYRFIRWATGESIAPELVMLGGLSACRSAYTQREILDTYPWLEALEENIRMGMRKPIFSRADMGYNQRDFEAILGMHVMRAVAGEETPREALEGAQRALDAAIL